LMIILVPAFGKFLSSCSVHIGMYNLCYIRTTRTHTHTKRIGSCPKSNDPRIFSGLTARPHTLQLPFFFCFLPHVPTTTHQNKQTQAEQGERGRTGRRAGSAGSPPRLLFFLHLFFSTQDNDSQKRGPNSLFHHAHIFLPFFLLCALGFYGARGRFPTPHHRRAREIAKGVFFSLFFFCLCERVVL
jgi:hypothetical protein